MKLMVCLRGETDQLPFLDEISKQGAGIELGSFGMIGIKSERDWRERFRLHTAVVRQFKGPVALHGPFIGIEYGHIDHLIASAVSRRLDMTYLVARKLGAFRVVLHTGFGAERVLFKIEQDWLERNSAFWKNEIKRWEKAGIGIVLENEIEKDPDLMIRLADDVASPFLGLCLDVGHQHLFSSLPLVDWVAKMSRHLRHIHLHDNDRTADHHWSPGRGTIDFEAFFSSVERNAPGATISLETADLMSVRMKDLSKLASRFPSE